MIVNGVRLGGVVLFFDVAAEVFGHRVVMGWDRLIIGRWVSLFGRFLFADVIINFCYII